MPLGDDESALARWAWDCGHQLGWAAPSRESARVRSWSDQDRSRRAAVNEARPGRSRMWRLGKGPRPGDACAHCPHGVAIRRQRGSRSASRAAANAWHQRAPPESVLSAIDAHGKSEKPASQADCGSSPRPGRRRRSGKRGSMKVTARLLGEEDSDVDRAAWSETSRTHTERGVVDADEELVGTCRRKERELRASR